MAVWSCFLVVLWVEKDKYPTIDDLATKTAREDRTPFRPQLGPIDTPGPLESGYHQNRYDHIIREAAERFDVDFYLIKGVIKAESHFNAKAISPRGASGLMQLMPHTVQIFGVTDPFNPRQNIFAGVRYLKNLINIFEGDLQLALAAYNAGIARVRSYGGIPPYSVTRTYLVKVLAYAEEFKTS